MGIRWRLFSGEDAMTEVGSGLGPYTWVSKKSPIWSLLDFRLALLASLSARL